MPNYTREPAKEVQLPVRLPLVGLQNQRAVDPTLDSRLINGYIEVGADQILTTLSGQIAQMGGQVPFIAPYAQALQTTLAGQMQQPVQEHQEKTGRAVVDRTTAAVAPILSEIQSKLRQRATQVQATAEHRTIEAEAAFQREVRGKLNTILGRLNNSAPRRY